MADKAIKIYDEKRYLCTTCGATYHINKYTENNKYDSGDPEFCEWCGAEFTHKIKVSDIDDYIEE